MFASTELAARIERAEVRLLADCAAAAQERGLEADVVQVPIAGGLATYTGRGSPLNKLAGLGFGGEPGAADLDALEREFASRGTPVQAEVSTLADPAVVAMLTRRGYVLMGFENVLGRPLTPDEAFSMPPEVVVTRGGAEDLGGWLDTVVTGFANPDDQGVASHESFPREILEHVIGDMIAAPGFGHWMAHRADDLVGGASLRLSQGVAQLCGAATLPQHRRRGVQTALLFARLAFAATQGCDVAVITTQPGSKSMQNAQRQGFELLYARAVLVREH